MTPHYKCWRLRLGELTCTKSRKSHSNHCSWCQKSSKVLFVTCLLHRKLSSGPELCCPRRRLEQDRRLWLQTPEQNKNLFASDKILRLEQRSKKAMASSWHYSIFNWKGQINSQAGHESPTLQNRLVLKLSIFMGEAKLNFWPGKNSLAKLETCRKSAAGADTSGESLATTESKTFRSCSPDMTILSIVLFAGNTSKTSSPVAFPASRLDLEMKMARLFRLLCLVGAMY